MFTVVIPVYRLQYLAKAVRSVLDQEPAGLLDELLLVTDGLDGEDLPLAAADGADPRVRVIKATSGMPSSGALKWNAGLHAAQAPWVVLFADDDVLGPGALARLASLSESHPAVGVLRMRQCQIDGDGELIQVGPRHPAFENWWDHWLSRFSNRRPSCLQEFAVRRDLALAVGGIPIGPTGWWGDDVFVVKAAATGGGIASDGDSVVFWRHDGHNVSAGAIDAARVREARSAVDELEEVLAEHGDTAPVNVEVMRTSIHDKLRDTIGSVPAQPARRTSLRQLMSRARGLRTPARQT